MPSPMKILFDQGTPAPLRRSLAVHSVNIALECGWSQLENGALLNAAERAAGAHPYFVPVEHTRYAREQLGPKALLAPELTFALGGREPAREFASLYLGLGNYTNNLMRHGFTEDDVANGGSDRLIDAVVPNGSVEAIVAVARAHFDAGADHLVLQAAGEQGIPRAAWTALAEALR